MQGYFLDVLLVVVYVGDSDDTCCCCWPDDEGGIADYHAAMSGGIDSAKLFRVHALMSVVDIVYNTDYHKSPTLVLKKIEGQNQILSTSFRTFQKSFTMKITFFLQPRSGMSLLCFC